MGFLNPWSVVTFFIASVLFFEVAPHLGVLARTSALAVRISAVLFALNAGWTFLPLEAFLFRLPAPELTSRVFPLLLVTSAWGCLAWAGYALVEGRRAHARHGDGPELR